MRHPPRFRDSGSPMPALDQSKLGSITPRYLLKIAKARLAELDALGLDPSSEDYLARRVEIMDLDRRGAEMAALDTRELGPQELKQDAWLSVLHVMATSGARTRLMAAKMIADRSDPVPREVDDPEAERKKGRGVTFNLTVVNQLAPTNGHGNGHQAAPGAELRPHGVRLGLGDGGREGA